MLVGGELSLDRVCGARRPGRALLLSKYNHAEEDGRLVVIDRAGPVGAAAFEWLAHVLPKVF